ncbi:MAG: glutamyl-tRNA reductase [Kiloniellales bacterium]
MAEVAGDPTSHLLVVGVKERSAGTALRERLFAEEPDPAPLLSHLRGAGVGEAVVLATCERVELLAVEGEAAAGEALLHALAEQTGIAAEDIQAQSFRCDGLEALTHLFRVAASLDSQVVGEPQILGQIKDCHRLASEAGMVGPTLEAVFQAAYGAAKRVRSETALGEQPVSIAASALQIARDVHGDLSRRSALLLGLGEMGEFMAAELLEAGVSDLVVMHVSLTRAEAVARRLGCHFRPWEELDEALAAADIAVAALGTGRYTVTADQAEAALKRRRREPIFFIDAAVPADIDPAAVQADGAFVYDLEDLERVALKGKATREAAADAARGILGEELAAFLRLRAERSAVPAVAALRQRFEAVRQEVLADGRLSAEDATRLLVNRLLHDPSEVLRAAAGKPEKDAEERTLLTRALARLFRIDDGRKPGKEND